MRGQEFSKRTNKIQRKDILKHNGGPKSIRV